MTILDTEWLKQVQEQTKTIQFVLGGISIVINHIAKNSSYADISYIPVWLVTMALLFATLVGMAAGFLPALRAMRLSPLAALRNE